MTNLYVNRLRVGLGLQQPTGNWTNGFAYDAAKRLTGVTSPAGTFTYTYDASRLNLPVNLALPNSSYITNIYDPVARLLTTLLKTSGGTTLDAAEYGYNVGNQRTTFTNAAGTYVSYTYDNISQLTVAASSTSSENRGYLYDAAWNLGTRTNNGATNAFTVNGLNELTVEGTVTNHYDAFGNVTNRTTGALSTTNFVYDGENRLVTAAGPTNGGPRQKTTFVYDGLGRLREQLQWTNGSSSGPVPPPSSGWKLTGGTYYVYDGKRVIQERNTNNTPTVSYTRGNDLSGTMEGAGGIGGLLARSDSYASGSFTNHDYYHADGNGNITYLETSSQTLAASYRYDPFGNLTSSSGTLASANTYRFSSKEYIPSVGIYYYLYRFYDPGAQRWLNRDPIEERGGINLYTFVVNQPIGFMDRWGLKECAEGWGGIEPTSPGLPSKGNCWRFACWNPQGPNDPVWPDPSHSLRPPGWNDAKKPDCPSPCDALMNGINGAGGSLPVDGKCAPGTHMIQIQYCAKCNNGGPGFHFSRQCPDGTWWDKPGIKAPRPAPGGGGPTTPAKSDGYQSCGATCVPDGFSAHE